MKTKTVLIALLWLASLVGAWWFGRTQTSVSVAQANGQSSSAPEASSSPSLLAGKRAAAPVSDRTKPAMSYTQILAQVKMLSRQGGMNNPANGIKLMGLLAQIRDEDIQAALKEVEGMNDQQSKAMLMMALLSRWAEKDATAAMSYADTKLKGQGMTANMAKMGIVSTWAQSDPEAVWKWYQDNKGNDASGGMMGGANMSLTGIFSSLVVKDPDKAFARLDQLEGLMEKQMAMAGMFQSSLFDESTREKVLAKVQAIEDKDSRKQMQNGLASQWLMFDQENASKWIESLPEDQRSDVARSAGAALLMNDPKKGAEFMLRNATEADRPKAYSHIAAMWANQNPNAAGEWLGQQPQGPELDEARTVFAQTVASKDGESAIAWAKTITDPAQRVNSVQNVWKTWRKTDALAADAALQNAGLSAEKVQQLLQESGNRP